MFEAAPAVAAQMSSIDMYSIKCGIILLVCVGALAVGNMMKPVSHGKQEEPSKGGFGGGGGSTGPDGLSAMLPGSDPSFTGYRRPFDPIFEKFEYGNRHADHDYDFSHMFAPSHWGGAAGAIDDDEASDSKHLDTQKEIKEQEGSKNDPDKVNQGQAQNNGNVNKVQSALDREYESKEKEYQKLFEKMDQYTPREQEVLKKSYQNFLASKEQDMRELDSFKNKKNRYPAPGLPEEVGKFDEKSANGLDDNDF